MKKQVVPIEDTSSSVENKVIEEKIDTYEEMDWNGCGTGLPNIYDTPTITRKPYVTCPRRGRPPSSISTTYRIKKSQSTQTITEEFKNNSEATTSSEATNLKSAPSQPSKVNLIILQVNSGTIPTTSNFVGNIGTLPVTSNLVGNPRPLPITSNLVNYSGILPKTSNLVRNPLILPKTSNLVGNPGTLPVTSNLIGNSGTLPITSNLVGNPEILPISSNVVSNPGNLPVTSQLVVKTETLPVTSNLVVNSGTLPLPVTSNLVINQGITPVMPNLTAISENTPTLSNFVVNQSTLPLTSNFVINQGIIPVMPNLIKSENTPTPPSTNFKSQAQENATSAQQTVIQTNLFINAKQKLSDKDQTSEQLFTTSGNITMPDSSILNTSQSDESLPPFITIKSENADYFTTENLPTPDSDKFISPVITGVTSEKTKASTILNSPPKVDVRESNPQNQVTLPSTMKQSKIRVPIKLESVRNQQYSKPIRKLKFEDLEMHKNITSGAEEVNPIEIDGESYIPKEISGLDIYGLHVAERLCKLDPKTRDFVQKSIDALLFDAEIGLGDFPNEKSKDSRSLSDESSMFDEKCETLDSESAWSEFSDRVET